MSKQIIGIGASANDNTGDTLRAGGDKINDNFNEVYGAIGNGTDVQLSVSGPTLNQVGIYVMITGLIPSDYLKLLPPL